MLQDIVYLKQAFLCYNNIMNYSLTDSDIYTALQGKINIIPYNELPKYHNINELIKPYDCCIILHQARLNEGHWACLVLNKTKSPPLLEYFNSYGDNVDEFSMVVDEPYKTMLHEDYPYLSMLMIDSPYELSYNERQMQEVAENISTCGRYCILRCLFKDMDLYDFLELFNHPHYTPDEMSIIMTENLF